jgi:hypothetical protein
MKTVIEFDVEWPASVCRECGSSMRMFGVEGHPTLAGMLLRSHECQHCQTIRTDIVPANTSNPHTEPLRSVKDGLH